MLLKTSMACALLALAAAARADTIEVVSTTALATGQQPRAGGAGTVDLNDTTTAYGLLDISAREITNPLAADLRLSVSIWGAYDLGDHRRWDSGTASDYTGDVQSGYVEGRFLRRSATLRIGRTLVSSGVGQVLQLDGGLVSLAAPLGLRMSAYAGVPVAQRFSSRSGVRSWNPVGGDLAYGGRLGWALVLPGLAGRGADVGAFGDVVSDGGDPVRQEVGADWRLQPFSTRNVTLAGVAAYSVYDARVSQASATLTWAVHRDLQVTADWRFTAPDLLLSRSSVLSVFSASEWTEAGGGVAWDLNRMFSLGADYHVVLEPGEDGEDAGSVGNDGAAWVELTRGATRAGLEASWLDTDENGAVSGRIFAKQALGRAFLAVDVSAHLFRHEIKGEDKFVSGTLSTGLALGAGFSAVLAARAGMNPYLEQTFDVMAKLTYGQTYHAKEVVQ